MSKCVTAEQLAAMTNAQLAAEVQSLKDTCVSAIVMSDGQFAVTRDEQDAAGREIVEVQRIMDEVSSRLLQAS